MEALQRVCELKIALSHYNTTISSANPVTSLKPRQVDALYNIFNNKDTFIILPTGYGKSLIFELIPFYVKCKTVILEPLNSIILQLCEKLKANIIHITDNFTDDALLQQGDFHYITGHPESILNSGFLEKLLAAEWIKEKVVIVVDEAHCILQWQDDFRPVYRNIRNLKAIFTSCTMCAMTATVSKDSLQKIRKQLQMMKGAVINTTPLLRKNISLFVRRRPGYKQDASQSAPYDFIFKQLFEEYIHCQQEGMKFPLTIVYTKLIWCSKAIELAKILLGENFYNGEATPQTAVVVQYHSPQDDNVNAFILQTLASEENHIKIIFATIALGMGADLKRVHRVIHAGPPSSIEDYVQEIGRAGRSGLEAKSTIFINSTDLSSPILTAEMKKYLKSEQCRRAFLTDYFKCPYENAEFQCCDVCCPSGKDEPVKGQNQVGRFLVRKALQDYVEADVSGVINFHINEELINRITETFELIPLDTSKISTYFQVPQFIAESIKQIILSCSYT